jgi:hypothetical protein
MSTDIKSKYMSATGASGVGGSRTRVRSVYCIATASAGVVSFKDGSASGTELLKFDTPAGIGEVMVYIPDNGILFQGDPYLTLTNVTSVTFFYG